MSHGASKRDTEKYRTEENKTKSILKNLKSHPNFKMPNPDVYRNAIVYSCVCVSELISPFQKDEESNHIECIELAAAIRLFSLDIETAWINRNVNTMQ